MTDNRDTTELRKFDPAIDTKFDSGGEWQPYAKKLDPAKSYSEGIRTSQTINKFLGRLFGS